MLGSIWIVSKHFRMLPPPTQHLVKSIIVIVAETNYTRNTSLNRVTDYVCII